MAMIARIPVCRSKQNTTCSWPCSAILSKTPTSPSCARGRLGRGGPAQRRCRVVGGRGSPRRPFTIPLGSGDSRVKPPGDRIGGRRDGARGGRSVDTMWDPRAERMSADERAGLQASRLDDLLARLAEHSPFYRERLADLPFTTKQDLWDHYPWGLLAVPREQVLRVHGSSGTGGRPTLVAYSRGDLAVWAEVCARALGCAGAGPGTLVHNAYGYGLFTGGLGMHQGAELMGCTLVPVSGGQTQRQVALIRDLRPEVLCCTPSYAVRLGEALGEAGIPRDEVSLRVGIFGAEPWSEAMRAQIEAVLPLKALDIYGLSEIIGPGVSCECVEAQAGLHVNEDHFLVEVVDPDSGRPLGPGERGELVFTTLTKEAMPLLRYRTGDIAAL